MCECMYVRITRHALHEKGIQGQLGVGILVSNQERRALVVPLVKRWLCSSIALHRNSCVLASKDAPGRFSPMVWKLRGTVVFLANRPVGVSFCPFSPRPAAPPPRCAPLHRDPPVVCQGFKLERCLSINVCMYSQTCLACKGYTETIRRRYTGPQPGTKSVRGSADQPLILFLHRFYIRIIVFLLPETRIEGFSPMVGKIKRTVIFLANRPVGVSFCPSPPRLASPPRRAPPHPDPLMVCQGFKLERCVVSVYMYSRTCLA